MYQIKIPIGDWSGDGHSECDWYLVESNKPVEEVREIHYRAKEVTGIDIEEICSEYEENVIECDLADTLKELGFVFENDYIYDQHEDGSYAMTPYGMFSLWVFLLQKTDDDLVLRVIEEDEVPMLPFYGFDDKKRHIGFVGYGCFN